MDRLSGRWSAKFISSRVWPLVSVILLFLLWMISLAAILSSAKVGETLEVSGTFKEGERCKGTAASDDSSLCFSGRVISGNVAVAESETFLLQVEDEKRTGRDGEFQIVVREWLTDRAGGLSFCLCTARSDPVQAVSAEQDQVFTLTIRRESLLNLIREQKQP